VAHIGKETTFGAAGGDGGFFGLAEFLRGKLPLQSDTDPLADQFDQRNAVGAGEGIF
jgi:hypothetical protein